MNRSRSLAIWLILITCALAVLSGMAWLTRHSLQSEHQRNRAEQDRLYAEQRADIEERTRLALWRLDAFGSNLLIRANQIPTNAYLADSSTPPATPDPSTICQFEIRDDAARDIHLATPIQSNTHTLSQLTQHLQKNTTPAKAAKEPALPETKKSLSYTQNASWGSVSKKQADEIQRSNNLNEKLARAKVLKSELATQKISPIQSHGAEMMLEEIADPFADSTRENAYATPFQASWKNQQLFLLRSVTRWSNQSPRTTRQGIWLDSSLLTQQLLSEIHELLPKAHLSPIASSSTSNPLALVSLPFVLDRNETPALTPLPHSRLSTPLKIAWAAVLAAILASAILVRGIMRLSERRASFVSAVTHELRTPLTTFQLYTEILEANMLTKEKRSSYLRVLSTEAHRLAHLVENVLAFSRIERGSAKSQSKSGELAELLSPMLPRFQERLAAASLSLATEIPENFPVTTDTAILEHILFNLIDNAAKYATPSTPAVVLLKAVKCKKHWEIQVQDHGPGIPKKDQSRIFRAFHKSAREAAETQPGVGLGLALSLRLAKSQGGTLLCSSKPNQGTTFTLVAK